MSSKSDGLMKRWQEQRWLLDTVIRTIGMEWDQGRLRYMSVPGGPAAVAELSVAAGDDRSISLFLSSTSTLGS